MTTRDADLRELIAAARSGDRAAEDVLFSRYWSYLVLVARMSLRRAVRAKVGASDVVQETFLNAHEALPEFRGTTSEELTAWLRRVLARCLLDAERRYRRNGGRDVALERSIDAAVERSSEALLRLPAARGTSPSAGAARREDAVRLADGLDGLDDDDREVIVLRTMEGLPWSDVGARMGRSPDAVRTLWGRAVARLGSRLEGRRGAPA
jgi:RNA polymerase sigma-70 factor (ECF subfamily)